jgi:hypothetical protein
MRTVFALELSDRVRRALRHYYGASGLATRREIRNWLDALATDAIENVLNDLNRCHRSDGSFQNRCPKCGGWF